MYLEHDLYDNTSVKEKIKKEHNKFVSDDVLVLVDENKIERPVYKDSYGRNHLVTYKEICYMHIIKELSLSGAKVLRIEGSHYSNEDFRTVVNAHAKAVKNMDNTECIFKDMDDKLSIPGYTLGSFDF